MFKKIRQDASTEKYIREWELEKGIKLANTKGFPLSRNKVYSKKFNDNFFRQCAQKCAVKCKTEKGLKFLNRK